MNNVLRIIESDGPNSPVNVFGKRKDFCNLLQATAVPALNRRELSAFLHHHRAIYSQPKLTQTIFKKRVHILNGAPVSGGDQRCILWTNVGKRTSQPDPDGIVALSQYGARFA